MAASEQIYEYIVFRGSDVKDLRIEQAPAAPKENQPPPVPDDPAIVGVSSSRLYVCLRKSSPQSCMMKNFGCKHNFTELRKQPRVDISVAFLLIYSGLRLFI